LLSVPKMSTGEFDVIYARAGCDVCGVVTCGTTTSRIE
jgi:hypothetical protein